MSKLLTLAICLVMFSCAAQQYQVMTYNIRLDVRSDGENAWSHRKDFLLNQLKFYEPDILGTQEALPHQLQFLDDNLEHYNYIGQGRDGGDKGEHVAVFYNSDKFKVLKEGTFWLSPTPGQVSKGWNAAYLRISTYGLFQDKKTAKKFWVFNAHLDNQSQESRLKSAALIQEKIEELNTGNFPFLVMGDFNVEPEDEVIKVLGENMQDAKEMNPDVILGPEGTFNAFQYDKPASRRIDYIMFGKGSGIGVMKYAVLTDARELKYPSDHFPVYVSFTF